jgi:hypothetical protein
MAWTEVKVKEARTDGGEWETPPEGNHPARLCGLFDVGHHDANAKDGSVYQRLVGIIAYELDCQQKNGQNFIVAEDVTLSMAMNSSLYARVATLHGPKAIGEVFDPSWIAGRACFVQITHVISKKGNTIPRIQAVTAPTRGAVCPKGGCDVWSLDDGSSLPDCSRLPRVYHFTLGKMLSISEWVDASHESQSGKRSPARSNGDPTPKSAQPLLDKSPAKGVGPGSPLPPGTSYDEVPF